MDFLPIENADFDNFMEIIENEKPLLKLINNRTLILVLDKDLNLIGFLRKRVNSKSIEDEINQKINDSCITAYKVELREIYNEIHQQMKVTCASSEKIDLISKSVKSDLIDADLETKKEIIRASLNLYKLNFRIPTKP